MVTHMPPDPAFLARLSECVSRAGSLYALAKRAGLKPPTIRKYLRGSEPARPFLIAIAKAADVSVQWLATGDEAQPGGTTPSPEHTDSRRHAIGIRELIPEFDKDRHLSVRFGPAKNIALFEEWFRNHPHLDAADLFHFFAPDRMMEPTIPLDAHVIVDFAAPISSDGIYAFRMGDQFMLRRFQFVGGDRVHVSADSKNCTPFSILNPRMSTEVSFFGKVVFWTQRA